MPEVIPFNKPSVAGRELEYIAAVMARGNLAGDGRFSESCSRLLEKRFGIGKVMLTSSCTAALEIAALLCNLRAGDEVIMPSFTDVATANAFLRAGGRPVFVDVRAETLNLDEDGLEAALTERTRAIALVHYGGISCDIDRILAVARPRGIRVVEDAAQGVGASYRGRALGSIGDFGCFSFHETKNVTCGQGGALCVNRREDLERAEILRDRGTNRAQFLRGEVDRYSWMNVGSASVLSEILSAYLYAQLEVLDALGAARARAYGWYIRGLEPLARQGLLRLPVIPAACESNHHICFIILADETTRDRLLEFLRARSIHAVWHFQPLHTSAFGRSLGAQPSLPVTEGVSSRLLRLPLYHDLTEADVIRVVETIEDFFAER